jgi:uncharacterized SAM-binding protein YcdF (DUF218 family)
MLAAAWIGRRTILTAVGNFLVAEDPVAAADVLVVSNAGLVGNALYVAELYRAGLGPRVALPAWPAEPLDAELTRLGIERLPATELARAVLVRSGVPSPAIVVLREIDGTAAEVAAVAAFAREQGLSRLAYVTARSHTARVRRYLGRSLPVTFQARVHSSRYDRFTPDGWWRSRDQARDVLDQYLRWANAFLLGDPWRAGLAPAREAQ